MANDHKRVAKDNRNFVLHEGENQGVGGATLSIACVGVWETVLCPSFTFSQV